MEDRQKPHLAWITIVVLGAIALGSVAWWLWSGAGDPQTPGTSGTPGADDPASDSNDRAAQAADQRRVALAAAANAIDADEFARAATLLDGVERRFGWSDEIETLLARLRLHEDAYRAALRPIEFRIEVVEPEGDDLYARFSTEGTSVFATEALVASFSVGDPRRRANLVTLRSSMQVGARLEILQPGGMFGSDEVVFGPFALAPLADPAGGTLELSDPDGAVRRVAIRYRPSPFTPGVFLDRPAGTPPPDASAVQLVDAGTVAVAQDDLLAADAIVARLQRDHPASDDVEFLAGRVEARREALARNRTTARFVILELAIDPKVGGGLWAKGGDAPSFRCALRSDAATLARTDGGPTAPYLVAEDAIDPPAGNVFVATARGSDRLRLAVTDTSPTFRTRDVGEVELPCTLAELPRGSGWLVVEREPSVLILPETDKNRVRRVVLRWTVER